jgi:hypothetical protein
MRAVLETAGERLLLDSELLWVDELLAEGAADGLSSPAEEQPSLRVLVERSHQPFDTAGWRLLTRGVHSRDGDVVLENACSSGFDLRLHVAADRPELTLRWRPPLRDRAAARALRSRFLLLARAVLIQYPALWAAGLHGRVPLHASGLVGGGTSSLVVAAGGVGRSTLLLRELASGAACTGDNLAVGDGTTVWGLVEPWRVDGGDGRRMYHGRRELVGANRLPSVQPSRIVVLERSSSGECEFGPCSPIDAARGLTTSTYVAGELRRYWAFAATLAAGTNGGPAHPPLADVAAAFASQLPCFVYGLGAEGGPRLSELLDREESPAWAC